MTLTNYKLTAQGIELILNVMSDLQLSQSELASKSNMSYQMLYTYLKQKVGASERSYHKIYEALGQDPRISFLIDPKPDSLYFLPSGNRLQRSPQDKESISLLHERSAGSRKGYTLTPTATDIIWRVMYDHHLTQKIVGEKCGLPQATISAYLTQKQGTSRQRYEKLYKALDEDPRVSFLVDEKYNLAYFSGRGLKTQEQAETEFSPKAQMQTNLYEQVPQPLPLYFQKIADVYSTRTTPNSRIKIIRSLDALIQELEKIEGGKII